MSTLPPCAIDLETLLIAPGILAPEPVCGSIATEGKSLNSLEDQTGQSEAILSLDEVWNAFPDSIRHSELLIGANIAYDFGVLAAHGIVSLADIFRAYDEGRVFDVLIAQALDAIAKGTLYRDPRDGGPLRDPQTGKVSQRYSLSVVTDLVLGKATAKENDFYRLRYGLLAGIPMSEWPAEAVQYPKDDARNTFDVANRQLGAGNPVVSTDPLVVGCIENLHDVGAQVKAAWALHLASMWGFRTDRARVEALAARVDADHEASLAQFRPLGFIRPDGSEDTSVVKRACAQAYGAAGTCAVCGGIGKRPSEKTKKPVNCKECDGTGFDLATAPALPRTEKGAISASRDTLSESGDDTLMAYGQVSESEKIRGTYLPFLQGGLDWPINPRPNVLVESGRTSYNDPTQTFPRHGGIRECIVPRQGSVFCSIDYSAIELCTLAQACLTLLGKSDMADLINATGDPGSLHTALAARMLGVDFETLKQRVKEKDPVAMGYRQAAKPAGFGFPGGMGASTLVLASRKGVSGTTTTRDGLVTYQGVRFCIHLGSERCGVEKTTEWKGKTIPPACVRCLQCAEDLRDQWFKQWPEMREFFAFVNHEVETSGQIVGLFSGMVRGGVGFTQAANALFQENAAFGAKTALYRVSRECYTDKKSPMYGARPLFFNHDEIFSEMPLSIASPATKRMTTVMVDTMREVACPDVAVHAEGALMWRWSKDAATVWDVDGNLLPDPRTL